MSESLFPLESVENHLRSFERDLVREGSVLRWPSMDGVTSLTVQGVDYKTHDGLTVSEVVTLAHESPLLREVDQKLVPNLNKWATLSALVVSPDDSSVGLVSKVGVFSTDREAAERVYAPLVAMEAGVIGWHAACLARGRLQGNPDASPLLNTDQQPPFDQAEFDELKVVTDQQHYLGSLGERAFTVEYPWDEGAVSRFFADEQAQRDVALKRPDLSSEEVARMGGKTSLLQMRVGEHPLYGYGIQSLLEIPLPVEGAAKLVAQLNRWEAQQIDTPPFFGSWCVGERAPAFVTFVPTQLCFPGLLRNLLAWAHQRHQWARSWLDDRGRAH